MSGFTQSPLGRLVLFIVCLSIAGSFVAGAHWYTIDLPHQNTVRAPPDNSYWDPCTNACLTIYSSCFAGCGGDPSCQQRCTWASSQCSANCWK